MGLLAATLAAVAIVALATGFRPSADELRDWGESLGPAGPVLFIPLSVALGCLLFPGPLLAGAAGLLFGTAIGTPIALAAATLTAVAEMLITRNVAATQVGALIPERARRIDDFIDRRGFWAVPTCGSRPGSRTTWSTTAPASRACACATWRRHADRGAAADVRLGGARRVARQPRLAGGDRGAGAAGADRDRGAIVARHQIARERSG